MNTSATPQRIGIGFSVVILLAILGGLWSIWQTLGINRNVVNLATNSVPSVVTLNKIIQLNNGVAKAVRQLVEQADDATVTVAAKAAFDAQRKEADTLCGEYKKLFSDAEDERLFTEANASRQEFLVAAEKAIALAGGQQTQEAERFMRAEFDPLLDRTVTGFNKDIDHNIMLAGREADTAGNNIARTLWTIIPTLALSTLLRRTHRLEHRAFHAGGARLHQSRHPGGDRQDERHPAGDLGIAAAGGRPDRVQFVAAVGGEPIAGHGLQRAGGLGDGDERSLSSRSPR